MLLIDADALYENADLNLETRWQMMDAIKNAPTINYWISVKDKLPELSGFYLVFRLNDGMYVEYFAQHTSTWFMEDADEDHAVAYWMPLPEAPEEVSWDA